MVSCKNCKWFSLNPFWDTEWLKVKYSLCTNPKTYENEFKLNECRDVRVGGRIATFFNKSLCGKNGIYFEQKK